MAQHLLSLCAHLHTEAVVIPSRVQALYPLRKLTPEIFWQATEVALEVMMGGKPEQGACTSEADLPQITNVVRHMQKMTWQAQGVARGAARTGEVAGNRYA